MDDQQLQMAEVAVTDLLDAFGDVLGLEGDWSADENLKGTPERVARMYKELLTPAPFTFTTFTNPGYDQIVLEENISFTSLCAHHLVPFIGHAHVAYLPNKKLAGLSKLARSVETFARALTSQEEMTDGISKAIEQHLEPLGSAVILEAQHFCMHMRGVKKEGVITKTAIMKGAFLDKPEARQELMFLLGLQGGK